MTPPGPSVPPPTVPPVAPQPPMRRGSLGFYALLLLSVALMAYMCSPFLVPLLLAAVLAAALMPLQRRVARAFRGRQRLAALVLCLTVTLLILLPLATVVGVLTKQVLAGLDSMRSAMGVSSVTELRPDQLPSGAQESLDHFLSYAHLSGDQLQPIIDRAKSYAEHAALIAVHASSEASFHSAIMLVALFFFLADGPSVIEWLIGLSPLEQRQTQALLEEFRRVSRATLLGTVFTALLQGVLASIGFVMFRVPQPLFFGLLTALASFIPAIGTAIVWGPACAYLWLAGHHGAAIGLLAFCLIGVVGSEHVAKPFIVGGQVEMHTGLIFLSLLGGLAMFGLIGIIAGPLIASFFLAMTRMYAREYRRVSGLPPPSAS